VRVQAETPPRFHYQTPGEGDGGDDSYWYNDDDSYWYNDDDSYWYNDDYSSFNDDYSSFNDDSSYDDDSFDDSSYNDAPFAVRTANDLASHADPLAVAARNSFLANDPVYDKYAGVANPMTTLYLRQGALGARLADATWLLSEPFADRPTALDDYLRCSTLARSCTPAEVLRRCTYEPRGSWFRERRSRSNAPLDWPYCEPDLDEVYGFCTETEVAHSTCEPKEARRRMAAHAAWVGEAVVRNDPRRWGRGARDGFVEQT